LAGVGPYYLARRQRVQGGTVGMAARAGAGDLRCPELVMAGCRRSGSTYLRDIRGGEVRPTRRPAARPGRAAGRFPCLVVEPRRRGDPEPYRRLPIRGVAQLGVVDKVPEMVSWVSLLMGIFSSGLVPVTSPPLVHSPLGGWRGCPPPHSALPRAAGGSGSREKAESLRPPKRPARRRKVSGPLTLRGDAPNGGECAMGAPEAVYQGLGLRGLEWLPLPGMADPIVAQSADNLA